jgi:predicted RNA methylase
MNIGLKTPGHDYFNDATWEVAVTLANDAKNFETIARLRKGGPVTAEIVKKQFAPLLNSRLFSGLPEGEIRWGEVAAEFNEMMGIEEPEGEVDLGGMPPQSDVPARTIDQDVLDVLSRCTTEERVVFLPAVRLDRSLYTRVNSVLEDLGGKWNKKLQGHIFENDPRDAIDLAVMTGAYIRPKDFGFFPTPAGLAEQLVMMAGLGPTSSRDIRILEPSAGDGAIADAAARWVGVGAIDTIELLQANAAKLREKGYRVEQADFLSVIPRPLYDLVVMNPPFGGQGDMRHIEHAARFLKPDGRLLAIMGPSFQYRSSKQAEDFRSLLAAAGSVKREIDAGAFKESGTMVRTVIVEIEAAKLPWNRSVRPVLELAGDQVGSDQVTGSQDAANESSAPRERMRA